MIESIVKRDGTKVQFNSEKITTAIYKAMLAVKKGTMIDAEAVSDVVVNSLTALNRPPTIEEVQDAVERELMSYRPNNVSYSDVAKAYILYRDKRRILREEKARMGVKDDLKLTLNAVKVLESRYLLKDEFGNVKESPRELLHRVAYNIGLMESLYEYKLNKGKPTGDPMIIGEHQTNALSRAFVNLVKEGQLKGELSEFLDFVRSGAGRTASYIRAFEKSMLDLDFVPNSPTLMNAGTTLGQLSACFVLPVDDSIDSIFRTLADTARIHKSGGGTGFSFSNLRPKDDIVGSTQGVASGALSFMTIFDTTTNVIKQGGKRRGANMGILRYDHPEITDFIAAKDSANTVLANFNISVGMDQNFFDKLDADEYVDLKNPRDERLVRRVKARDLWDRIIEQAWRTGDPGLIFLDEINGKNTVPNLGVIEATNPCAEQALLPYESCNLGSINLEKFVKDGKIDFDRLRETIYLTTRFLDDVIDANLYPVPEIEHVTRTTRKIGLGIMGFADMLVKLKVPYASADALKTAEQIMSFLQEESHKASESVAVERGTFPGWKGSYWDSIGKKMRNSTTTTIAPTGTISIIAGCSASIEPLFALAFVRHVLDGQELLEVNPLLESLLKENNLYNEELMIEIAKTGNLSSLDLPEWIKKIFETSQEIDFKWHVLMQAAFQNYCDSGVSKTINLPNSATREDISLAYRLSRDLHCKGITVYRDGSKSQQVLYSGSESRKKEPERTTQKSDLSAPSADLLLKVDSTYDPSCASGSCTL